MGNRYATICHHVFYKTKKNRIRTNIEYLSEKIFLRNAELVVVPSQRTAYEVERFGIQRTKIVVINPTHVFVCQRMPDRECSNRLLFVGNLEERKGVDILIGALPYIKDVNFTLDIVGGAKSGEYLDSLQGLVEELRLSDKVRFHGRVFAEKMVEFYSRANVFVFPSQYEGYGMVLLEAMSFGLPIVATDIPTTREIIKDKVNGYLCPVDDTVCLANQIRKLLRSKGLQLQIGKENFRASRKYRDWCEVAKETFAAFVPYLLAN